MERMSWVMELFDRMSGPANKIQASLNAMETSMAGGKEQTKGLSLEMLGFSGTAFTAADALGAMVKISIAAQTAFAVGAGMLFKYGLEMLSFKESSLATMKVLYGTKEAAQDMFQTAIDYARKTPFAVADVVSSFSKLKAAGFKQEEVPVVFQGVADIAALSGRGAESMNSIILAMSQIMGKGKLAGQEINQITEAAGGVVSRLTLFDKIGKLMGVTREQAAAMSEQGLIPARTAMMALMQISKDLGGGVIGKASVDQSLTLAGIWSNLVGMAQEMFLTMDFKDIPGIQVLKDTMNNLITLFSTNTESGKRFQAVLVGIINSGLMKLADFATPDGLTKMMDTLATAGTIIKNMWDMGVAGFQGLWDGLKPFLEAMAVLGGEMDGSSNAAAGFYNWMKAIGFVAGALATGFMVVFEVFAFAINGIIGLLQGLWDIFAGLAQFIIGGLVEGLSNGWGAALVEMESGINSMIDGAKRILGIASPSKVFEEMGQYTVAGYEKGLEGMPDPSLDISGSPAAGASAGGMNLTVQVNVNGHGGDGDSIAKSIIDVLPGAIAEILDRSAREGGLIGA